MKWARWKTALIAVVLLAMGLGATSEAKAWWYWRPAWWCAPCYYYPCVTVCDPCCDGYWYVGLRPGPIRRALFGPYRWYYSPGYVSCYVSVDCCDTVAPAERPAPQTRQPTVAPPQQPQQPQQAQPRPPVQRSQAQPLQQLQQVPPQPQPPAAPPAGAIPGPAQEGAPQTTVPHASAGQLTIWVPRDATVTINGYRTTSTGQRRVYVSYGLKPGYTYKYVVRAEVIRNGRRVHQTRTVYLTAGSTSQMAFLLEGTAELQLAATR